MSSIVGRLVANDLKSAMISLQLIGSGSRDGVDSLTLSSLIENLRQNYESKGLSVQVIGVTKAMGDIAEETWEVLLFMVAAALLVFGIVYSYLRSFIAALAIVSCSSVAVLWNLGLLTLLGYGIDLLSILVPFLIFSIGVSHGIQMIHRIHALSVSTSSSLEACKKAVRQMLGPGTVALLSDMLGFFTIRLIPIPMVQDLALVASLGILALLLLNLLALPLLMSYSDTKQIQEGWKLEKLWIWLIGLSGRRRSWAMTACFMLAACLLYPFSQKQMIGDAQEGVPELKENSRYNQDTRFISQNYAIGVDLIQVIAETAPNGCIDAEAMEAVDRLQWMVSNHPSVLGSVSLTSIIKVANQGWNEGHYKWHALPRDPYRLGQATAVVDTSSGLYNTEASVFPISFFLEDHRAETINSVIADVEWAMKQVQTDKVTFKLAMGNVGVMAAVNQVVAEAQYPILIWIYSVILILTFCLFRDVRLVLCVLTPLAFVSLAAYAFMAYLGIGLKTSTLPVVALGVGVGVDYSIYLLSQMKSEMSKGASRYQALYHALNVTGPAILVTGITLSGAILTWTLSGLQFQVDMGILFSFMLMGNMLASLTMVPSLMGVLYPTFRGSCHIFVNFLKWRT